MSISFRSGCGCMIVAVLLGLAFPPNLRAQAEDSAFRIATSDGVTLRGHFFGGTKKSACVVLLHDLGELRYEKEWRQFAESLHKEGFAVLQFHFRGHGRSTEVDPDVFWSPRHSANRTLVKSASRDEIEFAKFKSGYHQYLINDLAAAKAYLDRKNDAEECNASNLILVANGRSGALAAAWIHAEMHRYRQMPAPFVGAPARFAEQPEGANLLCAIFVNLSPQIGSRKIALASALKDAGRRQKTPMVFLCGSEDGPARAVAKDIEKVIDPDDRIPFTGVTAFPDSGAKDVEKTVATDVKFQADLIRYFKEIKEDRGQDWQDRDTRDARFFWRNPYAPASWIPFNLMGESNPAFASYELFLPAR